MPDTRLRQRVRVTAPGEFHGCTGEITLIYYDHEHTGDSEDLILIELDDGRCIRTRVSNVARLEVPHA
jgi:hypothetical protein